MRYACSLIGIFICLLGAMMVFVTINGKPESPMANIILVTFGFGLIGFSVIIRLLIEIWDEFKKINQQKSE